MRMIRVIYLFVSFMFILSCSHAAVKREGAVVRQADQAIEAREAREANMADPADGLELPAIPATITDREARADYLLAHFWDALDFTDTRLSLDTAFMEQSFANFVSLFPHAGREGVDGGMRRLVERASACREASAFVMAVAEKYLADPNSPLRDEDAYISYAEAALRGAGLTDVETARMRYLLEGARMNRPGSVAADFGYERPDGSRGRLQEYVAAHGRTLLLFYDPDCENCKGVIESLRSGGAEDWSVIAVYPDGDRTLWLDRAGEMPAGWEIGMDDGTIEERGLYRLPALPSIYLIDEAGRVVAKDVVWR